MAVDLHWQGKRVGKSTIWVRYCAIANSWQNRPATSVVWEWQSQSVLWALKSPHTVILAEGWRISALSILDNPASTTEQDDDGKWYKKNMKVVECRRTKWKHIRLAFILKNGLSSNRKIALNINTKAVHVPSILAMDWQVARQLEIRVLEVIIQVGFTESKYVMVLLEHKWFNFLWNFPLKPLTLV